MIHFRKRQTWAVLPVLWLSATMLLFQNLTAHYPAVPTAFEVYQHASYILGHVHSDADLRGVRPAAGRDGRRRRPKPIRDRVSSGPRGWRAAAALAVVVYLAGHVNNEKTMATANTRWPVWAWPQEPFPGRNVQAVKIGRGGIRVNPSIEQIARNPSGDFSPSSAARAV